MNTSFTTAVWFMGLCAVGMACAAPSAAPEAPAANHTPFQGTPGHAGFVWALGASVGNGATYPGSERRGTGISPVIGLALGRYTLSTGGGGALLDRDLDRADSGISARLVDQGKLRLSTSLRWGGGRSVGDEPRLQGLPDVRRTLRLRAALIYDVDERWSLRSSLSQDLLGRGSGAVLNNTARYELNLAPGTELSLVAGVHLANSTHMNSFFGVPVALSGVTTPLPAFHARAGMHSTEIGMDWRHNLHHHWVLLGGWRYTQLRGDARRSPLTLKPNNYGVSIGLAYRY